MSVPYRIDCSGCRGDIVVTKRELDADGDLIIEVDPCETCLEEAREKAAKEARDEGFEEGKEEGKREAEEATE